MREGGKYELFVNDFIFVLDFPFFFVYMGEGYKKFAQMITEANVMRYRYEKQSVFRHRLTLFH